MEVYKAKTPTDFERYANECLSGHEGIVIYVSDAPSVWTGQLPTINRAACAQKGLVIGTGQYLGGTIVNMVGDVSICHTSWGVTDFAPDIVNRFAEYMANRGIEVSRNENDILANGKKVLSWARCTTYAGWTQSVIHFSVGKMDLELVNLICEKPMLKEPGSLLKLGITTIDILSFLNLEENNGTF